ncbi:hypothetical protein Acy02nite_24130 [Actinoplanes cyaneus]|uniref:Uncharacterized protein n=1 Tax=Actinoplanes cyaneus TaxID=52696 RepID=A0A919IHM4_9ACTN|nr:hypothetical protein [Actinoplanes cyaneus]MCW2136322.1 hypothetical protein [Actinoplanes cyaneus]GID64532.1 hypothetical protein Acy02nite_24130 [Actinoplanes cyaneus]
MDRIAIDGVMPESGAPAPSPSPSSSSSAGSSALPQRRKDGRDRIYRQPAGQQGSSAIGPVEPPAGGWFGDAEDAGGSEPVPPSPGAPATSSYEPSSGAHSYEPPAAAPDYGPASPGGPGRASFGFTAGPISGNRPLGGRDDDGAFPVAEPEAGGLPVVRRHPGEPPAAPPVAAAADRAAPQAPATQPSPVDSGFPSWEGATWADTLDVPRAMPGQAPAAAPATRPAPFVPRRRSRLVTAGMSLLGTIAVLVIAVTGVVYYSGPDSKITDVLNLGGGSSTTTTSRLVTAPINGRTKAAFEMLAASDRIRVSIADIGDDLFRISTPDGSPLRPSPQLTDDAVRLQVNRDGAGTDGQVEVVLAARVRWTLRFSGYAAECDVDLGEGRVDGIELVGGTRRAVMALSKASRTVPVKIVGGVEDLTLRAPAGNPIRVKVGGGATTVTAGARTLRDVAPGSTLTPKDWNTTGRYDVETASKIALLSVEAG